jgi:glycosyltransferase involved in cell wall biosynthesis
VLVTGVIPTAGRRQVELVAAIQSVNAQTLADDTELVIVDDSTDGLDQGALRAAGNVPITFVRSGEHEAGRQTGVLAASGKWVAFLDDDDTWEPRKLELQVEMAEQMESVGSDPIVSCRVVHGMSGPAAAMTAVPDRLIADESVDEYLFLKRSPRVGRASIFTSTILTSRTLCLAVPWRRIPRHQDWDWLVRADQRPEVRVRHRAEVLARIAVGSPGSISASADWRHSLAWANERLISGQRSAVRADFLTSQTLRYALNARSVAGTLKVLGQISLNGRIPSLGSTLSGTAGLAPRRLIELTLKGRQNELGIDEQDLAR